MAEVRSSLTRTLTMLTEVFRVLEPERERQEREEAVRLNPVAMLLRGEIMFSRLLADLWDPDGTHGQGALFLNGLLREIGANEVGVDEQRLVRIKREFIFGDGRRIDILIETPDSVIGVEVKLDASEGTRQLSDYARSLNILEDGRNPRLIFLSMDPPSEENALHLPHLADAENAVSLTRLLGDSLQVIPPTRVRVRRHIEEIISFVSEFFGSGPEFNSFERLLVENVTTAFQSDEHRRALAMTLLAQSELHGVIIGEIEQYLRRVVADDEPVSLETVFHDDGNLYDCLKSGRTTWGLRRKSWPKQLAVALYSGSQNSPFGKMQIGVHAPERDHEKIKKASRTDGIEYGCLARKKVEAALRSIPDSNGSSEWWPWWRYLDSPTWDQIFAARLILETSDGRVENHPAVKEVGNRFASLWGAVDRVAQ